jgi:2-polyprenyl-3-methyl-5-hydroxy-6-metoxy-1,4-benzoquinol methylase
MIKQRGYDVVGVDPSPSAISRYRDAGHDFHFRTGGDTPDSIAELGKFDVVCSLEVVEHVYSPNEHIECVLRGCQAGGLVIFSTPYHGYWKNLAIAVIGGFDRHFTALWDGGHIKFWSPRTLQLLLSSHGLQTESVDRVGRWLPAFAKSMIVVARPPKQ